MADEEVAADGDSKVNESTHTTNWPDLAIGLYDRLTGRNAEISYDFTEMRIEIPSGTGADAQRAEWTLNGTLSIRTRDLGKD